MPSTFPREAVGTTASTKHAVCRRKHRRAAALAGEVETAVRSARTSAEKPLSRAADLAVPESDLRSRQKKAPKRGKLRSDDRIGKVEKVQPVDCNGGIRSRYFQMSQGRCRLFQ